MLHRRWMPLILSTVLVLFCLPLGSYAADFGDFSYETAEDGVTITGYSGTDTEVDIPETIEDKPVVAIGQQAFEKNDTMTHVTIPESVTSIGVYAFHSCTALTEISLPAQTATIQAAAFYNCTSLERIAIHHATCSIYDAEGTISKTAEIVGYDPSTAQQYAERYNRKFSSLGEAPCTEHRYTSQVTKQPTCTEPGERTYTCSQCGASYTEEIPANGHTEKMIEEVPATCTEDGYSSSTVCSVCGETLQGASVIPATGHTPVIKNSRPATCTTDGETGETVCSVCNTVLKPSERIPATGHTPVTKDGQPATCKADGETGETICSVCNTVLKPSERIPATGHDCVTELTAAQPNQDGVHIERCTVCGQEAEREVIAYPKTITLSNTLYTYSGAQRTPTITITDRRGDRIPASEYTVSYPEKRKRVGKYTICITFCGEKYTGQMEASFRIRPKATRITAVQGKSRGLKIAWKKQAEQTSGYQVQYSRSASFSKASRRTIAVHGRTSKTLKGLKRQKTYYVRVRTYKTMSDGTRNVSAWSSVKAGRTKK